MVVTPENDNVGTLLCESSSWSIITPKDVDMDDSHMIYSQHNQQRESVFSDFNEIPALVPDIKNSESDDNMRTYFDILENFNSNTTTPTSKNAFDFNTHNNNIYDNNSKNNSININNNNNNSNNNKNNNNFYAAKQQLETTTESISDASGVPVPSTPDFITSASPRFTQVDLADDASSVFLPTSQNELLSSNTSLRKTKRRSLTVLTTPPKSSKSPTKKRITSSSSSRKSSGSKRGSRSAQALKKKKLMAVLPVDHRPARGRGRSKQLQTMTKDQIKAEAAVRAEKNRVAAKECRARKKSYIENLKMELDDYQRKDVEAQKEIARLKARVEQLLKQQKS